MRLCERTGKRIFAEREVLDMLAEITRRSIIGERVGYRGHLERGAFQCADCGGFHLTSRPWGGNVINYLSDDVVVVDNGLPF